MPQQTPQTGGGSLEALSSLYEMITGKSASGSQGGVPSSMTEGGIGPEILNASILGNFYADPTLREWLTPGYRRARKDQERSRKYSNQAMKEVVRRMKMKRRAWQQYMKTGKKLKPV